jgi:hypothetical protein
MLMSQVAPHFDGGATPNTFDGSATAIVTLHAKAKRARYVSLSHSLSAYTTNESTQMVARLNQDNRFRYYPAQWGASSGPATNNALKGMPVTLIPVDFDLKPGGTLKWDVTSTGGTQTGTFGCALGIAYEANGAASPDVMARFPNLVPVKDGLWEYDAVAAATRQVLDGAGGAGLAGKIDVPDKIRELVALFVSVTVDGAVTAAENVNGYVDLESNLDIGYQQYPLPSVMPGAGTEVEGSVFTPGVFYPMSIPIPTGTAIWFKIYANLQTAVTTMTAQVTAWLGFR